MRRPIIDLGPEGGDKGGEIVATGTPAQIAAVERSYTGVYLRPYLNQIDFVLCAGIGK